MLHDVRTGSFSMMLLLVSLIGMGTLSSCLQWKSQPDPILFVCKGRSRLMFPWLATPGVNETVQQIKWIFDTNNRSALLASFTHNLFLTNPDYNKRVRYEAPGCLVLRAVKVSDAGNYSIEVTVKNALTSCLSTYRQSVILQVGDNVMMEGGQLQAHQDQVAHWEEKTQQWFIHLTCGHFTFWGTPPVYVVFTAPSGEEHVSEDYKDGDFYLRVKPSELQGGAYSCEVPKRVLPDMCFIANPSNVGKVQAGVTVNDMKARLSVVETGQRMLLESSRQLEKRLATVEMTYSQHLANATYTLTETFEEQIENLQNAQETLRDQFEELKNGTQGEYQEALNTFPCTRGSYTVEDNPRRDINKGDGSLCDKNLVVGWYRFQMNGEDAEIPTSCTKENHCSTDASGWLDLQGKQLPKVGKTMEARGCASWSGDCCNWTKDIKVHNCGAFYVYYINPFTTCSLSYCVKAKGT